MALSVLSLGSRTDESGTDPCVEWTGAIFKRSGYGKAWYKGQTLNAHRVAYIKAYGIESVEGKDVDHLCNNRLCVNAQHLQAVSHKTNTNKSGSPTGINSRKTECDNGHPYTKDNTYEKYGYRYCRVCHRVAAREYRKRKAGVGVGGS